MGRTFQSCLAQAGVLVWAGGGGGYWDPGLDFGLGRPMAEGQGGLWLPYYRGGNNGRVIAFDVGDVAAPRLSSDLNLAVNEWWNFSAPYPVNGLVYLSHQAFMKPAPVVHCDNTTGQCWTNPPPDWVWVQRWFLDVVDYTDPKEPTVREPVNVPGTLQGVSRAGELIYTVGPHWTNATNWWYDGTEYVDASAFDGVKAHLIDSLKLSTLWPHPVLVQNDTLFIGQPAETAAKRNSLESWKLSNDGKLTQLGKTELNGAAQSLAGFGNLLAAQIANQ